MYMFQSRIHVSTVCRNCSALRRSYNGDSAKRLDARSTASALYHPSKRHSNVIERWPLIRCSQAAPLIYLFLYFRLSTAAPPTHAHTGRPINSHVTIGYDNSIIALSLQKSK